MRLLAWIKKQDDTEFAKIQLGAYLGRSSAAVTAYIYGYRRVPDCTAKEIEKFTNGDVCISDLNAQFDSYQSETSSYGLSMLRGQKAGRPLLSISNDASEKEKLDFVAAVSKELGIARSMAGDL
ncbi:helix-turn-helix domain-containing protein [Pseudoalteromonas aurantia]|uniref:Uncharacterized protein n=1 Tax=Pseudoalteromonas aurantia TaxID=43654 RepID=A0ABY2VYP2_9GAMM|nr:helix-turn-helix domain-containing protein [Pseudoalteromonas aurantia]TMO75313.1 hypothetical protein CWC20_08305 [Pseudoalteromonas aurantia]